MGICCIFGCKNRPESKKQRFFYVPRIRVRDGEDARLLSIERRKKCFAVIKRDDLNEDLNHHRICEEHFVSKKMAGLFETSSIDWLPSLKLGYGDEEKASSHSLVATERLQRRQDRKRKTRILCNSLGFSLSILKHLSLKHEKIISPSYYTIIVFLF